MLAATEAGAIVFPPVPAFYARPASLADMVDHSIARVLDLFDLDAGLIDRWSGVRAKDSAAEIIPLSDPSHAKASS